MRYRACFTLILILLINACKPHTQIAVETKPAASAEATQNARELFKQCGNAQMILKCDGVDVDCVQTALTLKKANREVIDIAKPKELALYTAVGLGCATAKDNISYFVVQYGELPYGCEFCEWFHLYDIEGQQLTHSNPSILIDHTMPNDKHQMPNNREFDELSKELDLNKPHIEFIN